VDVVVRYELGHDASGVVGSGWMAEIQPEVRAKAIAAAARLRAIRLQRAREPVRGTGDETGSGEPMLREYVLRARGQRDLIPDRAEHDPGMHLDAGAMRLCKQLAERIEAVRERHAIRRRF